MQHKCKVTVIDKKIYPELQAKYCADPNSGACPCYNVGDEFIFERYGNEDHFWHIGLNSLVKTKSADSSDTAGGKIIPHCSEAWDAVSRYVYTALQGGSIMRGWMNDERVMIACCSDGTRPVIFRIERIDYKVLYIDGLHCEKCEERIEKALRIFPEVTEVVFRKDTGFTEVFLDGSISDSALKEAVESCGAYEVKKID